MGIRLAVNGTLMRGLALNGNLLAVGATFARDASTAPEYRLWSIGDVHPAMVRVRAGGAAVAVEVWDVPDEGLARVLLAEPPGLSIGKVRLDDGEEVLGVLGEPALCEGEREITAWGGWRAYVSAGAGAPAAPAGGREMTEADVQQLATYAGLSIDGALRPAVARQLTIVLAAARLVDAFPLDDTVEPAPEFRA